MFVTFFRANNTIFHKMGPFASVTVDVHKLICDGVAIAEFDDRWGEWGLYIDTPEIDLHWDSFNISLT